MTEKTLTTENIKPALDALRGELAPWPVVAKKQDRLNTAQLNAANSGITSSLVAQIIANTAAIRALESAIAGTGLRALVVASLPAVGTTGILYIVPVTTYDPETDADVVNYSNEYIWIVAPDAPATEGYYEQVGQTGIVINNGQLTITVNGTSVGTFTANQSGDTTAAITVPTNADYVDRTTDQTVAGKKTWTGEQSFTLPIVGSITGTAAKAIADEDGTSIKTGYGKLANVNTWAVAQVFLNALRFNNTSYVTGTPSANIFYASLQWGGYVNNTWSAPFTINNAIRTNGYSDTSFRTYSQTSNTLTGFVHETNADASDISFRPIANETHKLGSSSYQWSAVYAQSYYYNGTAWGLDQANVWSNSQVYKLTGTEVGSTTAGYIALTFTDKNNANLGFQRTSVYSDGRTCMSWKIYNTDSNSQPISSSLEYYISKAGVKVFAPGGNATTDLGTSTYKWKTLNGVNPGALSLPDCSVYANVDRTDWVYDGGITQNLIKLNSADTVITSNGWLYIRINDTVAGDYFGVRLGGSTEYNPTSIFGESGIGHIDAFVPVVQGFTARFFSTKSPTYFKFYPCLGNV